MTPNRRSTAIEQDPRSPPEAGHHVELDEGILWIRLPIPGSLGHINVWLVPGRRGWFLVDTGMGMPAVEQAWQGLERQLPLATGLEQILVTHHHPDHYGMANWLAQRYGVGVLMTADAASAAAAALADDPPDGESPAEGFAARLGIELDADMRRILRGGPYRQIVSGVAPAELLDAGPLPGAADASWQVSAHDGHAPGHACLFHEASHLLISGDQLLPKISSNISLYPSNEQGDPLGDYLASLDGLALLPEDTRVLPAHGRPFTAMHARIGQLRQEHQERLDCILALCAEPRSTRQVAGGLFRLERLDALNRLMATTETLAHLRRLELAGDVRRDGAGSGLLWRRA
jgi:glyoxylase-like metal-dependent hydrolase (beta-lactamase superfamily II)